MGFMSFGRGIIVKQKYKEILDELFNKLEYLDIDLVPHHLVIS